MIPNCPGCLYEYEECMKILAEHPEWHFAGIGFQERGHFFMRIVDDKGYRLIG